LRRFKFLAKHVPLTFGGKVVQAAARDP
jgi:hypothetical protein